MVKLKEKLPQEGSGCSAAGQSLTDAAASVFPSYSGGGKDHQTTTTAESDHSRSDTSMITADSRESPTPLSCTKRRPCCKERSHSGSNEHSSGDEVLTIKKLVTPKRGRGRPPTTGQYVGLKKAKEDYLRLQRKEMEIEAERELQERIRERQQTRRGRQISPEVDEIIDLRKKAEEQCDLVCSIATRSKNLKGTFQRALKDAASSIRACVESLVDKNSTDETRQLQAANARLQFELSVLKKEVAQLRAEGEMATKSQGEGNRVAAIRSVIDVEHLSNSIMIQVESIVNARFEALENKLLPGKQIGARSNLEEATLQPPIMVDPQQLPLATPTGGIASNRGEPKGQKKKKKTKNVSKKNANHKPMQRQAEPLQMPTTHINESDDWVKVTRRKGKTKGGSRDTGREPAKGKYTKVRLPRSTAIVLTLQPGAEERGLSYANILRQAKTADLSGIGLSGIRIRKTATGARILEIPGAASGEKADEIAKRLENTLDKSDVRVTRVTKCAEVRISELDDSVTKEEVISAISRLGGCSGGQIVAGEIRQDFRGLYTMWLRCPVAAARKVTESGRILIGWVSARAQTLPPRARLCWRCLEEGHVRGSFRCSKPGHKANTCLSAPQCILCAERKRPANHTVGSKYCFVSQPGKVRLGQKTSGAKTQKRPPLLSARSGEEMAKTNIP